jgi:hypothetical protein
MQIYDKSIRKELIKKLSPYSVTDTRVKNKKLLIEYKGRKCCRCNLENAHYSVYHFHHRNPKEKEFGISSSGRNKGLEELKKEADKCDLVCSNCHATIHAEEREQEREQKIQSILNE